MDIDKLAYGKTDGQKELNPLPGVSRISHSQAYTEQHAILPPEGYRKEEGTLTPMLFFVLSGGEVRERVYLQSLEKKREFESIRLVFLSSDKRKGGLTPRMMLDKWKEICTHNKVCIHGYEYHLMEFDRFFFLTDVDSYVWELRDIMREESGDDRGQWIISNPDFEIWLYYSFFSSPHIDLKEMVEAEPEKRSSLLKHINGRFNKGGGIDTRKAFEYLPRAIYHSKLNYQEDAMHFPALLSTQMHLFAEEIMEVAGEEYNRWLEDKKKKAKSFLKNQ